MQLGDTMGPQDCPSCMRIVTLPGHRGLSVPGQEPRLAGNVNAGRHIIYVFIYTERLYNRRTAAAGTQTCWHKWSHHAWFQRYVWFAERGKEKREETGGEKNLSTFIPHQLPRFSYQRSFSLELLSNKALPWTRCSSGLTPQLNNPFFSSFCM